MIKTHNELICEKQRHLKHIKEKNNKIKLQNTCIKTHKQRLNELETTINEQRVKLLEKQNTIVSKDKTIQTLTGKLSRMKAQMKRAQTIMKSQKDDMDAMRAHLESNEQLISQEKFERQNEKLSHATRIDELEKVIKTQQVNLQTSQQAYKRKLMTIRTSVEKDLKERDSEIELLNAQLRMKSNEIQALENHYESMQRRNLMKIQQLQHNHTPTHIVVKKKSNSTKNAVSMPTSPQRKRVIHSRANLQDLDFNFAESEDIETWKQQISQLDSELSHVKCENQMLHEKLKLSKEIASNCDHEIQLLMQKNHKLVKETLGTNTSSKLNEKL